MSETSKKPKRRGRVSKESLEVAEAISVEVASPVLKETQEPELKAAEEMPPPKKPAVEVAVATKALTRPVKVKAVATMRGQVGNFLYDIKAGNVYTLPATVAEWLISKGRAI